MDLEGLLEGHKSLQKKLARIPQQQIEEMVRKYGGMSNNVQDSEQLGARDKYRLKNSFDFPS